MRTVSLRRIGTVAAWRKEARMLALQGVRAEDVLWRVGEGGGDLFGSSGAAPVGQPIELRLHKDAISCLETALYHSDPERFARGYALILRLAKGEVRWGDRSDAMLNKVLHQERAVRRDVHKMHAFVRFREVTPQGANRRAFAAWFEPEHPIVEKAVPFFAKRFGDMDWIIKTPTITARFEKGDLLLEETRDLTPPPEDATEDLWRAYFANIFNPARLMVSAMTSEMPKKYWKNLPEARLIPELIRTAPARAIAMQEAMPTIPPQRAAKITETLRKPEGMGDLTLETLKPALDACRRCPIGCHATQGVAGAGRRDARLMVVGEQPGDQEDLAGRPFVGPAGQKFDACAQVAGLDRKDAYVTNAVKHFKFEPRGKRRLHSRPNNSEIDHCKWWLDFERQEVKPDLIVAMGATAAYALTGSGDRLLARRGKIERGADGANVLITLHPSYLLRIPDPARQAKAERQLSADLRQAMDWFG
ncbi:UdgX family uracil-DNA binding protein [Marivivens donghaensis]|uniref:Type-4 uracil-DNA glycosylase n=1 Tax=Marivivens donghaensis TaxID=1699413 RepID=A0ABX0VZN9_9RHOB|nr:UdgX family uracil-DNA binding protein [Marivivens donghaensis]NIY72721.1 UdgX family uracil-DNA binding protein [Marivivens donghaensis]